MASHLGSNLDGQMAQAPNAEDANPLCWASTEMTQAVPDCGTSTKQGRRIFG